MSSVRWAIIASFVASIFPQTSHHVHNRQKFLKKDNDDHNSSKRGVCVCVRPAKALFKDTLHYWVTERVGGGWGVGRGISAGRRQWTAGCFWWHEFACV